MGKVIGFEISSQNPEKAVEFYGEVFGWKISEPNWGYWTVSTGTDSKHKGIDGGISKGPHDYPHGTRMQIEVKSIEDTIKRAVENGALVVREKMEFDEFYLAYVVDPTGNGIGLLEKKNGIDM